MDIGARLTQRELGTLLVDYFQPELLDSPGMQTHLQNALGSGANIVIDEMRHLLADLRIFKKNRNEVYKEFGRVSSFYRQHRDTRAFFSARHQLRGLKKQPAIKRYAKAFVKLSRERWSDSFEPASRHEVEAWKTSLRASRQSATFKQLSPLAREMFDMQLSRQTAGGFYANYGGLFNRKDRSFIWYASGPRGVSRESFASIQTFFAKDGISLEFRPEASRRTFWRETLEQERRQEILGQKRAPTTFDVISTSGNRIPDDLNRVYVTDAEALDPARALFVQRHGAEAIKRLGITFHLRDEQRQLYEQDMQTVLDAAQELGANPPEEVRAFNLGLQACFLTATEAAQINRGERPLHSYIEIEGPAADEAIGALAERYAQIGMPSAPIIAKMREMGPDEAGQRRLPAIGARGMPHRDETGNVRRPSATHGAKGIWRGTRFSARLAHLLQESGRVAGVPKALEFNIRRTHFGPMGAAAATTGGPGGNTGGRDVCVYPCRV